MCSIENIKEIPQFRFNQRLHFSECYTVYKYKKKFQKYL